MQASLLDRGLISDPQPQEVRIPKLESSPTLPERERKHGVEAVIVGLLALVMLANGAMFAQYSSAAPVSRNHHSIHRGLATIPHPYKPRLDAVR